MEKFPDCNTQEHEHIATFAGRLEAYASSLSSRERQILMTLIMNTMDPFERMRSKDTSTLLDPKEEEYLRILENEWRI